MVSSIALNITLGGGMMFFENKKIPAESEKFKNMMAMYCENRAFGETSFSQLQNWLRLAKATINVPSVSSNCSRTKRYEEIRQKSQVEIKTIAFDFSKADFDKYEQKLLSVLKSMEVGVLVNNVGMSYEYPERLDLLEGGLKRVSDITVMNTLPVTLLSATVLSQMAQRNAGVVVNLSSSAAYHPMYYWAIYSATKKYVNWLSSILRKEYAQTNIVIQTVCPMMVATKMSKIRKTSLTIPTPSVYAKSAVNSIGLVDETTGCWPHELQSTLYFGVLPSWVIEKFNIVRTLMGQKVSSTEFLWVYGEQPHSDRRRSILRKYPKIKKLFGVDPSLKYVVGSCVLMQTIAAYLLKDSDWSLILLQAYFFGGLVNHGLALAIHDISHNTAYGNKRPISNRLFGMFANLPIGVPISVSFKKYHVEHHRYLSEDGLDTDLPTEFEAKFFTTPIRKLLWILLQPLFYAFRPLVVYRKLPCDLEIINAILIYDLLILYICGPRSLVYLIGGTLMAMGAHPSSGHFIAEHYAFNHDQETYSYYGPWNLVLYNYLTIQYVSQTSELIY
ncbi:Sphingolipid 4-desaturase [Aphelenchoides besseyi]|nr:Sphingolipid 4-desaturase [Aphelenchoides besseyi]